MLVDRATVPGPRPAPALRRAARSTRGPTRSSSSRTALANRTSAERRDAEDEAGHRISNCWLNIRSKPSTSIEPQVGTSRSPNPRNCQPGLDGDGDGEHDAGLDDDRRAHHRQDVAADDPGVAEAADPGGVDVQLVAYAAHRDVHEPVEGRGEQEAEDRHRRPDRRPEHAARGEQHDDAGQRHDQAGHPAVDGVEPAAEVAGDQSGRRRRRRGRCRGPAPPRRGCSGCRRAAATARRGRRCRCPASGRRLGEATALPMSVALGSWGAMTRASRPATTITASTISGTSAIGLRNTRRHSESVGAPRGGGRPPPLRLAGAHITLTFGLSQPVSRSMTRLTMTTRTAVTITRPMTSGMSPATVELTAT